MAGAAGQTGTMSLPLERLTARVCVAGGGPAGIMLGLLLARAGIDVLVLEKHADFFRDFRGDTVHPSTLDLIDQLGFRDEFEAIPHTRLPTLDIVVGSMRLHPIDFGRLRGRNREIALMPQWDLLDLLAAEGRRYADFRLVTGAEVSAMTPSQLAAWRSRTIGFVFQSYNLLPVLTAEQNVELPLLLTNLGKKERAERTAIALGVVGLTDRMDHFPRQLSGGQEQRVAIARAIVADPTLILLDEPTGQLDSKSADEVLELLRRLNDEFRKTIMLVTHDAKAADRAKTVLHLEKGVLLERERMKMGAGLGASGTVGSAR